MKTIYKYPLETTDKQTIRIPQDSTLLSVTVQRGIIVVYALVDTDERMFDEITFFVIGTGHPIENPMYLRFLGTVSMLDGTLMFHIFYK